MLSPKLRRINRRNERMNSWLKQNADINKKEFYVVIEQDKILIFTDDFMY
jgi:hypothetical protein